MKKLIALSLFIILGNGCKKAGAAISSVTDLRLSDNVVSGWLENTERYAAFDTGTFYNLIDGGAPAYNDQGLVDGFSQAFSLGISADTFHCQVYAMDFGTPGNAVHMFDYIKKEQTAPIALPGFDTTVAMASEFLGGYFAFAIFDRFYFEISVSGYADAGRALSDARAFVSIFKDKVPGAMIKSFKGHRKSTVGKMAAGCPVLDLRGRRLPLAPGKSSGAIVGQDKKAGIMENKIMVQ